MCPRCRLMLHDLGWCDLKDRRRDLRLALLYKIVTGHVAINPHQIGLVAADNRTRANHIQIEGNRSIFDWATLLICSVSDRNQLPAAVVEQENPTAFKAQLASAPATCHNPLPPLAWYSTRRSADYCVRQDKTRHPHVHLQSESAIPASAFPAIAGTYLPTPELAWVAVEKHCLGHVQP